MAITKYKATSIKRDGTVGMASIYSDKADVQNTRFVKAYIKDVEHYIKFVNLDDERATPARIVYNSGMFSLGTLAIYADRPINTTQDLVALSGSRYSENFGNNSDFKQYPLGTPYPDEFLWLQRIYHTDDDGNIIGGLKGYVGFVPWDRYPYNNISVKLPNIKNVVITPSIHQTNSGFHNHNWYDCRQRYSFYMNGSLKGQYTHQNNPSEMYAKTTYFPAFRVANISEGKHTFTLRIEVIDSGGYRQQIDIYSVNVNINGTRYYTEG